MLNDKTSAGGGRDLRGGNEEAIKYDGKEILIKIIVFFVCKRMCALRKSGLKSEESYLWQGGAEISRAVRSRARGGAKHPSADEKDKWQRR